MSSLLQLFWMSQVLCLLQLLLKIQVLPFLLFFQHFFMLFQMG